MRRLSRQDVEDLAVGAAILGSGGGGDPYIGKLMALQVLEKGMDIILIDPKEVPDDALVLPSAGMGTPTVLIEKLPKGDEALNAFRIMEKYLGKRAYATIPIEAGGVNSTFPLVVGTTVGIPIIDADGMGRAFPELQMTVPHLCGIKVCPMSMADEKGNAVIINAINNFWAEKIARSVTIQYGGTAWICLYSMTGLEVKNATVHGTISKAIRIGNALREARKLKKDPLQAISEVTECYKLFEGKIIDVKRYVVAGFARGEAVLEGIGEYKGNRMTIEFQNENLIARIDGEVIASVPDLITVIEKETGQPVTTEYLRYGYRVAVLGMPCDERWRTTEGLKVVGPRYFGYDIEYVPIEKRVLC